MSEGVLKHCKEGSSEQLIAQVKSARDPLKDFSEGILNFVARYGLNDHTSQQCHHEKVN